MKGLHRLFIPFALCSVAITGMIHSSETMGVSWQEDVDQGFKAAGESGRPMVIFVTMDGCAYCTKMKKRTLGDPQVVSRLNDKTIPIYIHRSRNSEWVQRLRVKTFPTTLFLTPDGKIQDRVVGFMSVDSMQKRISLIQKKAASSQP